MLVSGYILTDSCQKRGANAMTELTRRDFMKVVTMTVGGLALPTSWTDSSPVEIVDVMLDDMAFKRCCKVGQITYVGKGKAQARVTVDTKALWESVTLIDSEGRHWLSDGESVWLEVETEAS